MDGRMLRDALGTFPTGVSVITTVDDQGAPQGLTCNSFASLSLDPPLILWSIRRSSGSLKSFQDAGHFVVNVLAEGQRALSNQFATAAAPERFHDIAYEAGMLGGPVLEGCVASLECRLFAEHEAGDHILFIGEVVKLRHAHDKPSLAFYRGQYMAVARSLLELASEERCSSASLQEARAVVTGALIRLACERASPSQVDAIEQCLAAVSALTDSDDIKSRQAAGIAFFSTIADAADNEILSVLGDALNEIVIAAIDPDRNVTEHVQAARERIVDALRRRDSEAAIASFQDYLLSLNKTVEGPLP